MPRFFIFLIGYAWLGSAQANDASQGLLEQLPEVVNMLQQHQARTQTAIQGQNQHLTTEEIRREHFLVEPQAYQAGARDPFSATPEMQQFESEQNGGHVFQRSAGLYKIPSLKLKGVLTRSAGSEPLALLEIAGRDVYMVSNGDEISFDPVNPAQVLKIQKISQLSVVVEVGTLGDVMVVR